MDRIKTVFLRGLLTLLPIAVTIYVVYAGVLIFENILGGLVKTLLPEQTYVPGLGFVLTIILILIFGLLLNNLILQTVLKKLEESLKSIPLIKAVYSPIRDLMNLFTKNRGPDSLQSVVLVKWGAGGASPYSVGLITRDSFEDLPQLHGQDLVAVFLPFSYGLGGNPILFKKDQIQM